MNPWVAIASFVVGGLAPVATSDTSDISLAPPAIVVQPGEAYAARNRLWQGIPGIERAANGRLWVLWYSGGKGEGNDNYVVLVTSGDDGRTWSEPKLAIDIPGPVRAFDPCVWHDPTGRLWLCWAQSNTLYDGRAGTWAITTTDSSNENPTWSKPRRIAHGIMMNKPTALSTGDWAFPIAVWNRKPFRDDLAGERFSNLYVTADQGKTFRFVRGPDVPNRAFDEHMLVEKKDGSWWVLVRTSYGIGQSFSKDHGQTWSPGEDSGIKGPNSRFFIRRLTSGKLLLVNHRNFTGRSHLTASLSDDDGKTWHGHLLLDERPSVSYPDGVQAADGRIYIVYDRERGKAKEILMAVFMEEDVAKGTCVSDKARLKVLVSKAGLPASRPSSATAKAPPPITDKDPKLLETFLKGPMTDVDEIVFAVRVPGDDHWYANFGYYAAPTREYPPQREPSGPKLVPVFKEGGRLCARHLRNRRVRVLLDDPKGGVRDPQVHYDGRKILFSYRKGGDPYFHLHEINIDGSGLVRLTDGPFNDIEPTYLPDGGILFCSDRCNRFVNCWITPVATLYRCEADGSSIRMISPNLEHENTPWVLPDGRILYMRWEYVDRNQVSFHHLWTTNPDGTGQMVYFGNDRPGYTIIDAKPIPGTNRIVASFSPGHGLPEHAGFVTMVDPTKGPDDWSMARRISQGGPAYRDPYAFSDDCFLVAIGRELRVMDGRGRTEPIYALPSDGSKLEVHEPRPLRARPRERVIPSRVALSRPTGRLLLANIYEGRNMAGVRPGEIKNLLVLEQLPKPVNFSGGMWPISIGGTFTLSRVLGTVPVEPDGSAYMEVPALRPLFFVALDEDGLSVKRMHSFLSVEPGENTGCVGCHEKRVVGPSFGKARPAALRRGPTPIRPIEGIPDVFDFPRDIQPILDRHCVSCHHPDRCEGRVDLCGDHTPLFCESYWTITQRGLVSDGRNEPRGNLPPRSIGSSASPIMKLIDGSHHGAKPSQRERDIIRLWIESSAPYAGTYAALGSGMSPVVFPVNVMERRCGSCHAHEPKSKPRIGTNRYFQFGRSGPALPLVHTFLDLQSIRAYIGYYKPGSARMPQSLCNLTRPDKSLLLRAPLAQRSGGAGLCKPEVFATTDAADYQAILAAIRRAAARLTDEKRFDMPGFRPNDYYIYQMQRYGILPKDLKATDPIDVYATDEAYWRSFWYHPAREQTREGVENATHCPRRTEVSAACNNRE